MEAPHRGGGADLEEVWASPGGLTHPAPLGLDAIVQTCPPRPLFCEARRSMVPLQTLRCICLSSARHDFTLDSRAAQLIEFLTAITTMDATIT